MKILLRKYYRIISATILTLLFVVYYFKIFSIDYAAHISKFKREFSVLEKQTDVFLKEQNKQLNSGGESRLWSHYSLRREYNLHVYRNDSLVFWNTNHLPLLRFSDIHFPADGILHLQNGWYYAKTLKQGEYVLCASFLIKNDYSYENKALVNDFAEPFKIPFSAYIQLDQEVGYPIYSKEKQYLFSILPNNYQPSKGAESVSLMLLLVAAIGSWLLVTFDFIKRMPLKWNWIIPVGLLAIRLFSIRFVWFGFMHESESFASSLYGTNEWFPNFFEYLVNCFIIVFIVAYFTWLIQRKQKGKYSFLLFILLIVVLYGLWIFILFLNKGLIENSSIPLIVEKLFSLNEYSVVAIASMGLLYYAFYVFSREALRFSKITVPSKVVVISLLGISGLFYAFWEYVFGVQFFYVAIFPLVYTGLLFLSIYRGKESFRIAYGLLFLSLFSFVTMINLREFNIRKERGERELYANQLATEKDIVTEVEFNSLTRKIEKDEFLSKFIQDPRPISLSDFEDGIERRIFNGFWERYEMGFNLFDESGQSLVISKSNREDDFTDLNFIIEKHGQSSEIDSNLFFISDYTGSYSYIAKKALYAKDSSSVFYLFCTFKSKKIPEEIGFPRLLISSKAKVFEPLENYSIAKYYDSHLVTRYGKFNYPSSDLALNNWKPIETGYYNSDGFNHYVLRKTAKDVIVLSAPNTPWLEFVTSFSYLFSFFGLLLLLPLYRFRYAGIFSNTLTLALKVQVVLISLVFLSLLAFGWGSGVFVSDQYNEFTNDVIREKLNSVKIEVKAKLGKKEKLDITEDGNYIALLLQNFAKVFVTDINLYDYEGHLIASSRSKVFNVGLLSEQMNADAFFQVDVKDRSEFIHQENIGSLKYSSAYTPLYNEEGKLLAYLNLQHFGQQKDFENQIQHFLVAIINVFMLLLALSVIIAIFVSNWVTSPLRILQESFSNVKFGKQNQQIHYDKKDEIGALVKDYNQKLEELELTAQQLAKSERESAWREMAKQVAHEIKNPLTPMKLSIQQLQRVYDPSDPNSKAKIDRVAQSIIEQIDALTKIANEFSNFAKMPRPNEALIDLLPLLQNVREVFKEEDKTEISVNSEEKECWVMADKDLMLRVFNNLIKNAIQAIPEKKKGEIKINIKKEANRYLLSFSDNGSGIEEEKRSKIFVPYFTTKGTGTGLGLAMVKQIIENHRGTIWFESEQEKGTTFFIELPEGNQENF